MKYIYLITTLLTLANSSYAQPSSEETDVIRIKDIKKEVVCTSKYGLTKLFIKINGERASIRNENTDKTVNVKVALKSYCNAYSKQVSGGYLTLKKRIINKRSDVIGYDISCQLDPFGGGFKKDELRIELENDGSLSLEDVNGTLAYKKRGFGQKIRRSSLNCIEL